MANNKTTALELALEALERIATHEKECGERWTEAMIELRELKLVTSSHAERWEKLAWLVVGTVGITGVAAWAAMIFNINN
jgi:hypothetical protein